MSLKTDYKDDILATGNLRKYQMINNSDGTVSFQDVTVYEQTGDIFGAGDINKTNQAVNEKFDSDDVVDPMETTEHGFAADALAVKNQFNEQNKNLGKDLLWKNNDTLSSSYNFPAQSIQIEGITNYSMVMIVFTLFVNSSGGYLPKHIVVDEGFYGKQCHAMHTQAGTDMSAVSWSRPFTINEHGVVFENAKVTTGTTEQSNSTRWIPMSIYGIK